MWIYTMHRRVFEKKALKRYLHLRNRSKRRTEKIMRPASYSHYSVTVISGRGRDGRLCNWRRDMRNEYTILLRKSQGKRKL
jgi:hypothetical protein